MVRLRHRPGRGEYPPHYGRVPAPTLWRERTSPVALRAAFILVAALLTEAVTGRQAFLSAADAPGFVPAGGAPFGWAIALLDGLTA
jgi:hypothetical protein